MPKGMFERIAFSLSQFKDGEAFFFPLRASPQSYASPE